LEGFGVEDHPALPAAGAVAAYLERNQPRALASLRPPKAYRVDASLVLDDLAIRHLDLFTPEGRRGGGPSSLWEVLDHTATPMGARRLKAWLLRPLRDLKAIAARQDHVWALLEEARARETLTTLLRECADVERILSRLSAGGATGRDLSALRRTVRRLPSLAESLPAPLSTMAAGAFNRSATRPLLAGRRYTRVGIAPHGAAVTTGRTAS
jgi:DNA mismatch repair protein MutS